MLLVHTTLAAISLQPIFYGRVSSFFSFAATKSHICSRKGHNAGARKNTLLSMTISHVARSERQIRDRPILAQASAPIEPAAGLRAKPAPCSSLASGSWRRDGRAAHLQSSVDATRGPVETGRSRVFVSPRRRADGGRTRPTPARSPSECLFGRGG